MSISDINKTFIFLVTTHKTAINRPMDHTDTGEMKHTFYVR